MPVAPIRFPRAARFLALLLVVLAIPVGAEPFLRRLREPLPPPTRFVDIGPNLLAAITSRGAMTEDRAGDLVLYAVGKTALRKGFRHVVVLEGDDRGRMVGGTLEPQLGIRLRLGEEDRLFALLREPPRDGTRHASAEDLIRVISEAHGFEPSPPKIADKPAEWVPRIEIPDELVRLPRVEPASVALRVVAGDVPRDRIQVFERFELERPALAEEDLLDAYREHAADIGADEVWTSDDPRLVALRGGLRPQGFLVVFARRFSAQPGVEWELALDTDRRMVIRRLLSPPEGVPEGLHPGDVLLRIDGRSVTSFDGYASLAAAWRPGITARFEVRRGREELAFDITLAPPLP